MAKRKYISTEKFESMVAEAMPSEKKRKYYPSFYLSTKAINIPSNQLGQEVVADVKLYIKTKTVREKDTAPHGEKFEYEIEVRAIRFPDTKKMSVQEALEDAFDKEMNKEK